MNKKVKLIVFRINLETNQLEYAYDVNRSIAVKDRSCSWSTDQIDAQIFEQPMIAKITAEYNKAEVTNAE